MPEVTYSDGLGDWASAGDARKGPWVHGSDVTSGPTAFRKFPTAFRTLPTASDSFPIIYRRGTGARWEGTEREWGEVRPRACRAAGVQDCACATELQRHTGFRAINVFIQINPNSMQGKKIYRHNRVRELGH